MKSILAQKMDFIYEIIISDDFSTDGTWDLIQEYEDNYKGIIYGFQINSSDINPVNRSERCGYNKANAYKQARGKYFVNIDADDFLLGDDIYQTQVDMLEKHPDCVMCMQNVAIYKEGKIPTFQHHWFDQDKFRNEQVLTAIEYLTNNYFILNQAFVIRRINQVNPAELLGKHFDDTMISYFHMQFGNIIYISKAQYVYMVSENSINSSLVGIDREVQLFSIMLVHILFIPQFAGLFLRAGLKSIKRMMEKTILPAELSVESKKWLSQFHGFGFRLFLSNQLTIDIWLRKRITWLIALFIDKAGLHYSWSYKILYILLIGNTINDKYNFNA